MKYIPTSEEVEVKGYPYGYTLRTSLFDTSEFNPKKGYRHVTQTINPKNGVLNKPKKGVYYDLMVRYYDENGHIKTTVLDFVRNGVKGINKVSEFLNANFELFSVAEMEYLYLKVLASLKIQTVSYVQYCGSTFDDLKPLFEVGAKNMSLGLKEPQNNYFGWQLDEEAIENTKVKDYQPFKITSYVIDTN
jgi:hypothetical protein